MLDEALARIYRQVRGKKDPLSLDLVESLDKYASGEDTHRLPMLLLLDSYPVTIEEFILGSHYLARHNEIYPAVLDSLIELNNPEGDRFASRYYEAVLTGGIGTAKTTRALYTTAYQVYLLSCFRSPHILLGQDRASEIFIIFQSLNSRVAKDVDYSRFRRLIEQSPYFNIDFPFRKDLDSKLVFPHNISAFPVSGDTTATIGQNVYCGFIDEVNFMSVVDNSKRTTGGGVFDQARELYNSIASRRESRFMRQGVLPGILCLGSSKHYPGQFTDRKRDEARTDPGIYYRDDVVWEIKPEGSYTSGWFKVFVGTESIKPYIIEDESDPIIGAHPELVRDIPLEYKKRFVSDIYSSLREIAGVSTLATTPYIPDVGSLNKCFHKDQPSIFTTDVGDFYSRAIGINKKVVQAADPEFPRFAHVDLGLTSDHAGVVIGHVPEFVELDQDGDTVWMPKVVIDGTLRVAPPPNGEINFEKIRKLFYVLKNIGFPLRWITFDSYQSVDSMQILRSKGFFTGTQSMDTSTAPYDVTKTAILEGRLHIPEDKHLQMELARLERTLKGKVDHPPNFSKDVADALAGVVYGLTMQRYVWAMHGHQPIGVLDDLYDLQEVSDKKKHPDD